MNSKETATMVSWIKYFLTRKSYRGNPYNKKMKYILKREIACIEERENHHKGKERKRRERKKKKEKERRKKRKRGRENLSIRIFAV